jgi:hypothetical protein
MITATLTKTPETLWQQTPSRLNAKDRWQAYLGQLALEGVLNLLEGRPRRPSFTAANLVGLSYLTEAVAVQVEGLRLVLVPSEALDHTELRVPQEWLDLPSLVGDYYLAVQVEPDESLVNIWGYASHRQLKAGVYNTGDRTYSIPQDDLIPDLNVLWLSRTFCPEETLAATRAAVLAPAALDLTQARNLIDRLATVQNPRLEIPFTLWGALMDHGGWRFQLAQARQGLTKPRVLDWLSGVSIAPLWQTQALSFGGARSLAGNALLRTLTISGQDYQLRLFPQESSWRFELRSSEGLLPVGMELRLLTEDLQGFEGNLAIAQSPVEAIYIDVTLGEGEGLVWQVSPTPEDYESEILWF